MGTPIKCEIVFIVNVGPPPGSLEPRPKVHAVLIRLYPKPGMFTHISRGMESIPAVFVVGSMVKRINVSVQKGQSSSCGFTLRNPTNKMLMRLAPSQVGYVSSGTGASIVAVGTAVAFLSTMTGPSKLLPCELAQPANGSPGKDVSRQQVVKSRTKPKRPKAPTNTSTQKTRARIGKRWAFVSAMLRSSYISPFTTLAIVSLFRRFTLTKFHLHIFLWKGLRSWVSRPLLIYLFPSESNLRIKMTATSRAV